MATSDGKTQCVVGLPGDMIYDGGPVPEPGHFFQSKLLGRFLRTFQRPYFLHWRRPEAVRAPLGHGKEKQVGVDCPPAMHCDDLGAGALLGC